MPELKTAGNTAGWVKPNIIKSDFLSHPSSFSLFENLTKVVYTCLHFFGGASVLAFINQVRILIRQYFNLFSL
jgi:hypothetical protein